MKKIDIIELEEALLFIDFDSEFDLDRATRLFRDYEKKMFGLSKDELSSKDDVFPLYSLTINSDEESPIYHWSKKPDNKNCNPIAWAVDYT